MTPALIAVDRSGSPASTISGSGSVTSTTSTATSVTTGDIVDLQRSPLLNRNVRCSPLRLRASKGNWLEVTDGTDTWSIFDASGGAAVTCIGYKDRRVKAAIDRQWETGISYAASLTFDTDASYDFADFLVDSTNYEMGKVVFYGSGSEGTEASQKIAIQYHAKEKPNPEPSRCFFIARQRSYHGATLSALEMSGHEMRKQLYKPILAKNTTFIPPCNPYRGLRSGETEAQYVGRLAEDLESEILRLGPENVAGFFAEPVVGAALGCAPALPNYLATMKKICVKYGVLLILDEVMCGMGRTGYLHAWQDEGVVPDIQLVGKGLAGGYANISAMLIGRNIVDAFENGPGNGAFNHGHTFQNFSPACAAGLAVQRVIQEDKLLENVRKQGKALRQKLEKRLENHPHVGDIRGKGLFQGIEFVSNKETKEPFHPDKGVAWRMHERGLTPKHGIYIYPGAGTVDGIRGDHIILAPAYNVTDDDIELIVDRVEKLIKEHFESFSTSA